jgi:uracil-DNA glycosylase
MSKLYKRKLRLKDRRKGFFFDSQEIREKLPEEVRRKGGKKLKTFNCANCPLDKKNYVPGAGDPARTIWWLGRDPGGNEVRQDPRTPFVGRAGKLLRRIANAAKFPISSYGYIDNIVSCRPPGDKFNKTAAKCCYKSLDEKLE